jgi:hypothetical protein
VIDLSKSAVPAVVGPFRIVRTLGSGAMGVVYLGDRIEQFSQRVAIKMLHPHTSLLFGEYSLHHEEKVLTSLDHAAIVRLLDTGEHERRRYIVMEYVEGLPVDAYCVQNRLKREQRLELLAQIARAVDYAHRRLVIHADLKPENILITADGQPRILDFGVSVLIDSSLVVGEHAPEFFTPRFASPEQLGGERATVAADIYAVGKIGELLFGNGSSEWPAAGREVAAVFEVATRAEPERRYGTCKEFADDLKAVLEHRPVAARNGRTWYRINRWMRRHWAAATIACVLGLVLAGTVVGVVVQTARAARQRRVAESRLHDLVRLTGTLEGELYQSAHSLPQGRDASESLLQAATRTLDTLARQDADDSTLTLEIGRQYGKLAELEQAQGSAGEAAADLDKGEALLRGIPRGDRNYAAAVEAGKNLERSTPR